MICLGTPQASPTKLEAEAAQLRVVQLFTADFMSRHPKGVVLSELDYMDRTTAAPAQPGPRQYAGNPRLNRILDAMTQDFRRGVRERDFRKSDAIGLDGDALIGDLVEVTTQANAASATGQLTSKLTILHAMNQIHDLRVQWRPAPWRPKPTDCFFPLPTAADELRYVCYMPTFRYAPSGVILYEVHVVSRPKVPVPVKVPEEARESLRRMYRNRQGTFTRENARLFLAEHPIIAVHLRALALAAGVAMAVLAVILVFDPVPGDEAAAGAAALWLIAAATS